MTGKWSIPTQWLDVIQYYRRETNYQRGIVFHVAPKIRSVLIPAKVQDASSKLRSINEKSLQRQSTK